MAAQRRSSDAGRFDECERRQLRRRGQPDRSRHRALSHAALAPQRPTRSLVKRTSLDGSTNLLKAPVACSGHRRAGISPTRSTTPQRLPARFISYPRIPTMAAMGCGRSQPPWPTSTTRPGRRSTAPLSMARRHDHLRVLPAKLWGRQDNSCRYRMGRRGPIQPRGRVRRNRLSDGQWVVFNRRTVPPDPQHNIIGPFELYKVPISGDASQIHKLTKLNTDGTRLLPTMVPDGVYIIFQRKPGDQYGLYRVRADGDSSQTVDSLYTITMASRQLMSRPPRLQSGRPHRDNWDRSAPGQQLPSAMRHERRHADA